MKKERFPRADILPQHVGIIMDGNGRWASARALPRVAGHKQGAETFGTIARHARDRHIPFLTVYAFSTENWRRPPEEVKGIMSLLRAYLRDTGKYAKDNIKIKIIGDLSALDQELRALIAKVERDSENSTGITVNIALNYGGRGEIARAARLAAQKYADGEIDSPAQIDAAMLSELLYTAGQPEVDLIIRTGRERRLSNFLLWQGAYAELVFSDVLWPDFGPEDFDGALREFSLRDRRMGGV